ncbi:MAG: DUF1015 domain-containing protein [Planctomycetes bacterium]|nr:DUF1015 domain-containing protein [Planctomycetota bacterium]
MNPDGNFEIAPFRALRFDLGKVPGGNGRAASAAALVAPPYDIIAPEEHARLLEKSPCNIVHLTLGDRPGEKADYRRRGETLLGWKRQGILTDDPSPGLFVYGCEYTVPGSQRRACFRGLIALGKLFPFEARLVQPHEKTFSDVVDDRYRLLEATRTHLELIFLLYEDGKKEIDGLLEAESRGPPVLAVPGKPGETHTLWKVESPAAIGRLQELFRKQRPIIADGHHRYTTALLYRERKKNDPQARPGSGWQPMVFSNLVGEGLSILATHRLVDTSGKTREALQVLEKNLEAAPEGDASYDFLVETRAQKRKFRIPAGLRNSRKGAAATDYAILERTVLQEWLESLLVKEKNGDWRIRYFKEGSGEREALEKGDGDLLFRMQPVKAAEFRSVVDGGEIFPHKTTFFYPKIWSGLVLWSMAEPPSQ